MAAPDMPLKLRVSRQVLLASLLTLSALFAWQYGVWLKNGDTPFNGLVIMLLKLVPLLLVFPGVLKGQWRAHIWLSFISLFYFLVGCLATFASNAPLEGLVLLVASVTLFISSMLFARWSREMPA